MRPTPSRIHAEDWQHCHGLTPCACHPCVQVTCSELSSWTTARMVWLQWWHRAASSEHWRWGGLAHLLQRLACFLWCAGMAQPLLCAWLPACGAARAYPHVSVYVRVCIPGRAHHGAERDLCGLCDAVGGTLASPHLALRHVRYRSLRAGTGPLCWHVCMHLLTCPRPCIPIARGDARGHGPRKGKW